MTDKDRKEFVAYLHQCTHRQIQGVYDKEMQAGRRDYADLVVEEARCRGLQLDAYTGGRRTFADTDHH